jgi:hypothetical protein
MTAGIIILLHIDCLFYIKGTDLRKNVKDYDLLQNSRMGLT